MKDQQSLTSADTYENKENQQMNAIIKSQRLEKSLE